MGEVRRPARGIRSVLHPNPGPMTLRGTRTYAVGERRAVLLDPGPEEAGGRELRSLAAGAAGVEWVALTHAHPDHAGGAAPAARRLGARLAASPETLRRLDVEGHPLEDGDALPVDGGEWRLRAVEAPGHTADHLAYFRPADRVLFTGDLVLGRGSSLVAHPDGSVSDYLRTLDRLIGLRPRLLLPGHGPDVPDAAARLREYREHRLEREEEVLAAVRAGAGSVPEIRRRVYGDLSGTLSAAAEANVAAHLVHLRERGKDVPPPGAEGEFRAPRH